MLGPNDVTVRLSESGSRLHMRWHFATMDQLRTMRATIRRVFSPSEVRYLSTQQEWSVARDARLRFKAWLLQHIDAAALVLDVHMSATPNEYSDVCAKVRAAEALEEPESDLDRAIDRLLDVVCYERWAMDAIGRAVAERYPSASSDEDRHALFRIDAALAVLRRAQERDDAGG